MLVKVPMLLYYLFFFLCFFWCNPSSFSSETLVGYSYDETRGEVRSYLNLPSSQASVFVSDHSGLEALASTEMLVDLYLNESNVDNLIKLRHLGCSWVLSYFTRFVSSLKTKTILVGSTSKGRNLGSEEQLSLLLATLESVRSDIKSFGLSWDVKVAVVIPLSVLQSLESSERCYSKELLKVMDFVRKYKSFVVLETEINGEFSMGNGFVGLVMNSPLSAVNIFDYRDVRMVLNDKSSHVPSAKQVAEVEEFNEKMTDYLNSNALIRNCVSDVLAEISPMDETERKQLGWKEEWIFHSSRRELGTKMTVHETVIPTPTIVTIPSTNPVIATPINPATTPITVPATNPVVGTPINLPPMGPVTPPSGVPVGNTVPPPTTIPMVPPTNPVTAVPVPPTGGVPVTTPINNPVTPPAGTSPATGSGQSWCVAKPGVPESSLQAALDYACGMGGADCSAIQSTGSCYNPNTLQNHASYAFNSYYQKNPSSTSCDFKGAAALVNANPSTGSCVYPSSATGGTPTTPTTPITPTTPTPPSSTLPPPNNPTSPINPITPINPTSPINPITPNSPDSSISPLFGTSPPPSINTSSTATDLQPLFASVILASVFAIIF